MSRVEHMMTSNLTTIRVAATAAEAAQTMHRLGIRHLPVVDDAGHLVGILSDRDLRGPMIGIAAERGITGAMMAEAHDLIAACAKEFDARCRAVDVVVTPAACGEAPEGLHSTGDWTFNAMWTVMHTPCVAIPCIHGPKGLPVGVQIVGPRFSDARLLSIGAAVAPVIDAGN